MKENKLTLSDIKHSIGKMDLLDGAQMFLQNIRKYFQVVILSDTFYEFAMPLMSKMDFPLLLCHKLNVGDLEQIEGYDLRHSKASIKCYLCNTKMCEMPQTMLTLIRLSRLRQGLILFNSC